MRATIRAQPKEAPHDVCEVRPGPRPRRAVLPGVRHVRGGSARPRTAAGVPRRGRRHAGGRGPARRRPGGAGRAGRPPLHGGGCRHGEPHERRPARRAAPAHGGRGPVHDAVPRARGGPGRLRRPLPRQDQAARSRRRAQLAVPARLLPVRHRWDRRGHRVHQALRRGPVRRRGLHPREADRGGHRLHPCGREPDRVRPAAGPVDAGGHRLSSRASTTTSSSSAASRTRCSGGRVCSSPPSPVPARPSCRPFPSPDSWAASWA